MMRSWRFTAAASRNSTQSMIGCVSGRLDLLDGLRRYVGRVGVSDAQQNPLVMDWRADATAPFYRATAADPGGCRAPTTHRHLTDV